MDVENDTLLWINYGPIYYFSLFFGVMPFKYLWNVTENGVLNLKLQLQTVWTYWGDIFFLAVSKVAFKVPPQKNWNIFDFLEYLHCHVVLLKRCKRSYSILSPIFEPEKQISAYLPQFLQKSNLQFFFVLNTCSKFLFISHRH